MSTTGTPTLTELVEAAKNNEQRAWDQLVDRLAGLVWSVTQSYGLSEHDAVDVGQMTWMQLARQISNVREPECIGLWLATTTRRECMRFIVRRSKTQPVDPSSAFEMDIDDVPCVEDIVVDLESGRDLWKALEKLPTGCRALIRLFLAAPEPTYAEVASALDMPIGSVGPRRQRCLQKLRTYLERP